MTTSCNNTTNKNLLVSSFRAAISLNNMGVCTMEQGHFGAAKETLKDSLFIMKSILNQPRTTTRQECSSLLTLQEEDVKLQAARMRLAQSQKQPVFHPSIEMRPCDDGDVMAMKVPLVAQVLVVSSQQYGPPLPNIFIPIRLESSCSHQLQDSVAGNIHQQQQELEQLEKIFKIPSAVILYNYGLTNLLVHLLNKRELSSSSSPAMTTTTTTTTTVGMITLESSQQESLLHVGFVCFTMAHAILCQERAGTAATTVTGTDGGGGAERTAAATLQQQHDDVVVSFEILQAMILSGLVLHNLWFVFQMNPTTSSSLQLGGGVVQQVAAAAAQDDVLHTLSSLVHMIQVHVDVLRNMNVELETCKTACAA
jgi:hypothetical protein